ncbi:hypothetical protein [Desulfomarina profundi]|uniref:hypothetical protein n=1 Tax=Desulfomarina profundi TaxID=2772557 RepID=UPI001E40E709|nr:hypothetical protein [Desulfomarina profundi]
MKSYRVLASLKEDINSSTIWVRNDLIKGRTLAKLSSDNGKSVWVEIQAIDTNYTKNYNNNPNTKNIQNNEQVITVNEWYRNIIGLSKNQTHNLEIKPIRCSFLFPLRQMQAALKHPDSSIRICADLAIVSVFLGLLGLAIGLIK